MVGALLAILEMLPVLFVGAGIAVARAVAVLALAFARRGRRRLGPGPVLVGGCHACPSTFSQCRQIAPRGVNLAFCESPFAPERTPTGNPAGQGGVADDQEWKRNWTRCRYADPPGRTLVQGGLRRAPHCYLLPPGVAL